MTPDAYTNTEFFLDVGNGHTIYVHDWGNKTAAVPIVLLHGGPGGGFSDRHKQRFDPRVQRVIFHDQRGCGKSTPYGSIDHNTTEELVEDIEAIVTKLQLESFILAGSSWGSTLAFAYALKYPDRVKKIIVSGIFTGSQKEIAYLSEGLFRSHFPDVWERLIAATPKEHQANPTEFHYKNILGPDQGAMLASAKHIGDLEGALISLDDRFTPQEIDENFDPLPTKIETYYLHNMCFMADRYILENAHRLTMPVWLVQGRYDFVCPPETAWELHKMLPNSHIIWTQAGHGNDRNNYEVMKSLLLQASIEG